MKLLAVSALPVVGKSAVAGQVGVAIHVERNEAVIAEVLADEGKQSIQILVRPIVLVTPCSQWQELAAPARPNVDQVLRRSLAND